MELIKSLHGHDFTEAKAIELRELVERNNIGEPFNYDAEFVYPWYDNDKLVGIVSYMKQSDATGQEFPRFIHVIIDKEYRRKKEAREFVLNSFRDLNEKGYTEAIAIIPKTRVKMIVYALQLLFYKCYEDEEYGYWVTNIPELLAKKGG